MKKIFLLLFLGCYLIVNAATQNILQIKLDLNNDNLIDIIRSDELSLFGNAGGIFNIFINQGNNDFTNIGSYFGHRYAQGLEEIRADIAGEYKTRIWLYSRGNNREGSLYFIEIVSNKLLKSCSLTLHPGDAGTLLGNQIMTTIFNQSNQIKFELK